MSDLELMRSIVYECAVKDTGYSGSISKAAAKALYAAGFRLVEGDAEAAQNARLADLDRRLTRIEGWTGLPAYYDPPKAL